MSLPLSESYLTSVLESIAQHDDDDLIWQCDCGDLDVLGKTSTLFALADQKLHVFPFKEVKSCWFRLYTDTSIAKAVQLMLTKLRSAEPTAPAFDDGSWIDESVTILDMALIMAGGLGREDLIHELLRRLQAHVYMNKDAYHTESMRKLNNDPRELRESGQQTLPEDETPIPALQSPVSRIPRPSLEQFQNYMQTQKEPVILTEILHHWPALISWKSIKYWMDHTLGGRRLVPVELGRSYVDDDWGQRLMSFQEFLDNHVLAQSESASTEEFRTGYLAQHNLLKQIPSLQNAIAIPDYCYLEAPEPDSGTPVALTKEKSRKHCETIVASCAESDAKNHSDVQANVWFGPAWTISPLHHDPYHNILCQVVGKKYIRLYSPHVSSALHPRRHDQPAPHVERGGMSDTSRETPSIDMSNTSMIDISAMELSPSEDWDTVYPGFSTIPFTDCILEAGQALYIPVGWWHYVRSCSVGISVSFWW